MEREFEQLSYDVIVSNKGEYFIRVFSAESFTSKFYNEENRYGLSFKNVEVDLLQKGSFTTGVAIKPSDLSCDMYSGCSSMLCSINEILCCSRKRFVILHWIQLFFENTVTIFTRPPKQLVDVF